VLPRLPIWFWRRGRGVRKGKGKVSEGKGRVKGEGKGEEEREGRGREGKRIGFEFRLGNPTEEGGKREGGERTSCALDFLTLATLVLF